VLSYRVADSSSNSHACVQIRGARQNNLKGFDLDLPLGKLNVLSGPSGSGKSSLAFDTIYAEGQRRYVETFSPYTRQFLERMDKPKVDEIRGMPPAIAIEQSNPVKSSRSTVGTMTEINDYLKLLMPRIASGFCPSCGREVRQESARSIVEQAVSELGGCSVLVAFGVPVPPKTGPKEFFDFLQQQGYLRVWVDGAIHRTDGEPSVKRLPGLVRVIQDRVTISAESRSRLTEAVETALRYGKGQVFFIRESGESPYSLGWHCAHCDIEIAPPTPGLFSFNNPLGACPRCRGFGRSIGIDLERAIPDRSLSIAQGVVRPFQTENGRECQRDLLRHAARQEIDIHLPFEELPKADQEFVLRGERKSAGATAEDLWENDRWYGVQGFFDWLQTKAYKMHVRVLLSRYRSYNLCEDCHGGRFQPATLNFKVRDAAGRFLTLPDLAALPVRELAGVLAQTSAAGDPTEMLRKEVTNRLRFLDDAGVGYLSLDRPVRTLSGGEVERVNLTTCLGASLVNTLFVLDEPSIGLHPRDVGRLVRIMKDLRDKGNTLLVVEHDEAVIRAADHLIELGPGRGETGGDLVFQGSIEALGRSSGSLTADYLNGRKSIPVPARRRLPAAWLKVQGASEHNLRNIDADFPLGVFACVTGVSGSGKSTLVHDVLYQNLLRGKGGTSETPAGKCKRLLGAHRIERVVMVDQSPLSRTPRSSPAVYLGVFDRIREAFSFTPEALAEGLTSSSFSFNSGNGRCERCCGNGFEKIEMQFLSDLYVRCPECEGTRYQPHILRVLLRGKSIRDVLEMTVTQAVEFFIEPGEERISLPLSVLREVGLGYLRLGQPLNVLSGGESQRLKLVSHLTGDSAKKSLLIFDEPTTGLHFDDVALLIAVFNRLVGQGGSVLVIEHNLEVIKSADYVLDLGPEAGAQGGTVVATGTPEEVALVEASHTGQYLRRLFSKKGYSVEDPVIVAEAPPRFSTDNGSIKVRGAREHNLKDISVAIPRDQMVVITGLSGSGKSTLAFDILFAEGQRRFLDSMSPYARQFVEQLEKPDVDVISGLPPTVAIEQRVTRGGGKSTVATVTEVYHFLRLLFSKLGTQYCPDCNLPVERQSLAAATKQAETALRGGSVRVLASLIKARKGFHTDVAKWALKHGFETLFVDGKFIPAAGFEKLARFKEHSIDVLVGQTASRRELPEILARAFGIGRGGARLLDSKNRSIILSTERSCPGCGQSFEELDPRLFSFNSPHGWCPDCRGFGEVATADDEPEGDSILEAELDEEKRHEWLEEGSECPACHGSRLNVNARNVRLKGRTIQEVTALPVKQALTLLKGFKFEPARHVIAEGILSEIEQRLQFMGKVGLDYLSLSRSAKTLSGGESQRIRLAAQLGSNLRGVLYVLDEPTIGLHPRDNRRLLETLEALKQKGNSLVIVEHDEETMRGADVIIDLGPGAGIHGGEVVAVGDIESIKKNPRSATGRSLAHPLSHPTRGARRPLETVSQWIEISDAAIHNLKGVDVRFPIGRLSVITGVSGSGKSTLLRSVLLEGLARKPANRADAPVIRGAQFIEAVYEVDQSPIGKTSRSTPATYIKAFDEIRKQYATLALSRMRGYNAGRFSFNNEGGRCAACGGQGVIKVEMNFLPASYIPCADCHGLRYNPQTLEVLYNEKSIGDVMEMTAEQAAGFFKTNPKIYRPLSLMVEAGLGYLKLGQPSPTLSGGEAQRLKLVTELARGAGRLQHARLRQARVAKSTLYLLEEPTIGLHMADVQQLLRVLHRLVDEGGTVIVIEHNLSVIADADYLVDIGPEAGENGGRVVASGTPEKVSKSKTSRTAPFLREMGIGGNGR